MSLRFVLWERYSLIVVLVPIVLLLLTACERQSEDERFPALDKATAAADALSRELTQRLAAELDKGGPAHALDVCSRIAQELAAKHSHDGLTIRRVSRRFRNPADKPNKFEQKALESFAKSTQAEIADKVWMDMEQQDGKITFRYVRPIWIAPLCLKCHGPKEQLDPEVREILQELYPEDRATGYAVGDLRGGFSVRVYVGEFAP